MRFRSERVCTAGRTQVDRAFGQSSIAQSALGDSPNVLGGIGWRFGWRA